MSWKKVKLGEVLFYEQPTKYLVASENYNDEFQIPVLTAGKSFILGYTNETEGIFENLPVIIFDDFTADSKYVDFRFKVKSSAMKILQVNKEKADLRFLFYLIQTLNVDCEQHKRYWISKFAELEILLPPLPIQKRIAEILDAADALRRKDQELLRKYDELAQAIFIDMFGDPVKNEKGFITIRLGDCLDNIQIGPFGTQLHESDYIKNGIPLINPMHIGDLKIKPNFNYSISEKKYLELPQYHLKVDDVILARRGEMGRCAIVTEEQGKCLCGTGSLFLKVKKELLDPLFLVYVLSRKTTKIALENVSAGTTMANLNKNIISNFEIILPDIEKQKDFVNAIKMSEKSIEFTNVLVNKSNHIFDSLLQQAFKGELVK